MGRGSPPQCQIRVACQPVVYVGTVRVSRTLAKESFKKKDTAGGGVVIETAAVMTVKRRSYTF